MSIDTETGSPTLRDTIEASVASHSPGPDVENIVSGAREQHTREIRNCDRERPRDHHQYEGDRKDQLRSTIRGAIHENKLKIAAGPTQSAKPHEVAAGPPKSWDLNAQARWPDLPQEARLAIQREEAEMANAIQTKVAPHLQSYAQIDQVLGPVRERYAQHGLKSDAEAVHRLVQWESAFSNPATKVQATAELMVRNGITVDDLFALAGVDPRQYQQQHYQQQYDPVADPGMQEAHQQLTRFSEGKPHFEQVRVKMGELIRDDLHRYTSRDGNIDLSQAYIDACRHHGLGGDNRARRAASSPASRSPAVRHDTSQHSGGGSVRNSIMSAVRQSRGG